MSKRIRCRCPLCGMLVSQKQLDGEHDFEFIIHEIGSKGRGKIYNIYRKPDKVEGQGFLLFTMALAEKLYKVADGLLEKVRAEGSRKGKKGEKKPKGEVVEDKMLTPVFELSPLALYDVPVATELEVETNLEGEQKWQGLADLRPRSVQQTTLGAVRETAPVTVLED